VIPCAGGGRALELLRSSPGAALLPMPATTHGPCKPISVIATFSTRSGTPSWRRTGSRFLAVADMAISERELEAARTARAVRTARADARAADLAPIITDLQVAGATTLQATATELNRRGIPTATGRGEWSGKQVRRVLERLP
jgi:hypothetical protein